MGVPGLQSFVKREVPNGIQRVSIRDVCEEYKRNNNGEKPTIVFDSNGLSFIVNWRNAIYGGRELDDHDLFDNFFKTLSQYAKLVFFNEGPMKKDKQQTFFDRKEQSYGDRVRIFDDIKAGRSVEYIVSEAGIERNNDLTRSRVVKDLERKYGEYHICYSAECDTEIVKYINEHPEAIAVIADDTDFFIYPGNFRFFSLRGLNVHSDMDQGRIDDFRTAEYGREALRKYLRLEESQMITFSTLCGNDIIKYERRFTQFKDVARKIINNYPSHMAKSEIIEKLSRNENLPLSTVQASFDLYDTENVKKAQFDDPVLQYCVDHNKKLAFKISDKFAISTYLKGYDYRSTDFPNMFDITLDVLKKLAGIVFFESKPEKVACKIYGKKTHESRYTVHEYYPNYPEDIEVPFFIELLNREENPEHDSTRFALLDWIIGSKEHLEVSELPEDFTKELLSLLFMVNTGIAKVEEADILLLSLKRSKEMIKSGKKIKYEDYPKHIARRAFTLSFTFLETFAEIESICSILGLEDILNKSFYYDGVLFHELYLKYESEHVSPSELGELKEHRIYA